MAEKNKVFAYESNNKLDNNIVEIYVQRDAEKWDKHTLSKIGYKWTHCGTEKMDMPKASFDCLVNFLAPNCRQPLAHEIDLIKDFYKANPNFR